MEISQENVDMVCRQTNYSEEEAKDKLIHHQNDPIKVIYEYMNFEKKQQPKLSSNQQFHTDIRNFMKTSYELRPDNLKL